jgi:hypothetical protein
MDAILAKVTEFITQLQGVTGGMATIFSALVALALLALLFSRIGK